MMIDYEKKLILSTDPIAVSDIRLQLEQEGIGEDEHLEERATDEFNKYKKVAELYGSDVFYYNEESKAISKNSEFKAIPEYLLFLYIMTSEKKIDEKTRQELTEWFEDITAEAIKNYLGEGTKYRLIDQRNKKTSLKDIFNNELKEECHDNIDEKKELPRCDIIIWKPIDGDDRGGKIILLVQCKAGVKWRGGHAVNIEAWKSQIGNFACDPIKVYAITDLITKEDILNHSKEKGFIIDRLRLVKILANADSKELNEIRNKIDEFNLSEFLQQ